MNEAFLFLVSINKRTTMENQNRSAALGRLAMKSLRGGGGARGISLRGGGDFTEGGGEGGASTSLRSTNPRP